jgi:hypothetical protein
MAPHDSSGNKESERLSNLVKEAQKQRAGRKLETQVRGIQRRDLSPLGLPHTLSFLSSSLLLILHVSPLEASLHCHSEFLSFD